MARMERLLRWVWLVNGVLLLLLLLGSGVFVAIGALAGRSSGPAPAAGDSVTARPHARALRADAPLQVTGARTQLVLIRREALGAPVNAAFAEGTRVRLLLPRAGWMRRVVYPGAPGRPADEALPWIVYEMALEDTDRSGAIDEHDARSLYVTDLEGNGLRRVLPPGLELRDWTVQPDGALVASGIELRNGGAPRQHTFRLAPDGTVTPWAALDSVLEAAAARP